jgi:PAS domain S-box-containing protein
MPKALALPSPTQLEAANRQLEAEILERRCIEEKLRSSQEMLQLVMNNIPQFIFWKDRNSVFLGCNRNFAQLAGIDSPEDIVGKTDYDLSWKKEEADFFRECDRRVMERNTPEYHIIEPALNADGKQSWLDTTKSHSMIPKET